MPVCGTVHSNHVEPPANSQRFYAAPALRCVCLRHRFKPDNTFYISILSRCSRILWRHKVIVSFKTLAAVLNSNTRTKIYNWTRWQKQFSKNKSQNMWHLRFWRRWIQRYLFVCARRRAVWHIFTHLSGKLVSCMFSVEQQASHEMEFTRVRTVTRTAR